MFYRMLIVRPLVCFLLLTGALGPWATRSALAQDLWPRESLPATSRLQVNGFYRFAATYLDEKAAYPRYPDQVSTLPGRQIFVGDDAQLPNLWLNIKGMHPTGVTDGLCQECSVATFPCGGIDGNISEV